MADQITSKSSKTPLGVRLWLLLAATLCSNAADGFVYFATPLLALTLTKDPVQIAAVAAVAQAVPAFLGIVVGASADRHDRRTMMALAAALRAVVLVILTTLVVTGNLTMIALYILVALFAVGEISFDVAASASVLDVAGTGNALERTHGFIGAGQQVVQGFIAGPLAPIVFVVAAPLPFGIGIPLAVAAWGLVLILRMKLRSQAAGDTEDQETSETTATSAQGMLEGFREVGRNSALRTILIVGLTIALFFSFAQGSFTYYLVEYLGLSEYGLSIILIALGIGGLALSLTASRIAQRFTRRRSLVWGIIISSSGLALVGAAPHGTVALALTVVGAVIGGFGAGVWNVIAYAARQRLVPSDLLGRVSGSVTTVFSIAVPGATLLSGWITRFDPRLPWFLGAVGSILIMLTFSSRLAVFDQSVSDDSEA